LAELIENPRNPNTHPQRQIEMLGRIIIAQGWRAPITVSTRSGFIVRGHGRYRAALWAGLTHAPVDRQDYETDAAEWADLIADNRIAKLSAMSVTGIREILLELSQVEINAELTGYSQAEFDAILSFELGGQPIEGQEFDETAADNLNTVTCPHCGETFPV
jgi:hypothetical protein